MNIQSPPLNDPLVDKNGRITSEWIPFMSVLFQQLQSNLSDDGYVLPKNTAAQIAVIEPKIQPAILYNTTTNQPMIKVGNVFKTITTS